MAKTKGSDPLKEAKEAIDKVFSNTSVSPATTRNRMEELIEYCQDSINGLVNTAEDEDDLEADR